LFNNINLSFLSSGSPIETHIALQIFLQLKVNHLHRRWLEKFIGLDSKTHRDKEIGGESAVMRHYYLLFVALMNTFQELFQSLCS
jgi:hypothetical protein